MSNQCNWVRNNSVTCNYKQSNMVAKDAITKYYLNGNYNYFMY